MCRPRKEACMTGGCRQGERDGRVVLAGAQAGAKINHGRPRGLKFWARVNEMHVVGGAVQAGQRQPCASGGWAATLQHDGAGPHRGQCWQPRLPRGIYQSRHRCACSRHRCACRTQRCKLCSCTGQVGRREAQKLALATLRDVGLSVWLLVLLIVSCMRWRAAPTFVSPMCRRLTATQRYGAGALTLSPQPPACKTGVEPALVCGCHGYAAHDLRVGPSACG